MSRVMCRAGTQGSRGSTRRRRRAGRPRRRAWPPGEGLNRRDPVASVEDVRRPVLLTPEIATPASSATTHQVWHVGFRGFLQKQHTACTFFRRFFRSGLCGGRARKDRARNRRRSCGCLRYPESLVALPFHAIRRHLPSSQAGVRTRPPSSQPTVPAAQPCYVSSGRS